MGILIVQFAPPSHAPDRPRFCQELGVAAALLKQAGIDTALAATTSYDRSRLRAAVTAHRPTRVLMDVPATRAALARHTIADIAEGHYLPVILVGRFATSQPEKAISIPGVAALIQGEYERSLPLLVEALDSGSEAAAEVPGAWVNSAEGLLRNSPAPLIEDVDELPWADREIFQYARTVEAEGEATFYACRGCRNWCAHCLNDWYLNLYDPKRYLRRRDPARLLDEVVDVTGRHGGVKTVVFADHAFATDVEWLEAFAAAYPGRTQLPYRCRVAANAMDPRTPELLAASGCRLADVEVGSGSNFIREEVLTLRTSRRQIVEAVAALKEAGIAVRASVFVGAPYESEVSIEETLDLLVELGVDAVRPRVFYPIPGTRAAEVCAENGWISGRGEESFYQQRSVLDMPTLPARRINEVYRRYDALLRHRGGKSLSAWWSKLKEISTQPIQDLKRKPKK